MFREDLLTCWMIKILSNNIPLWLCSIRAYSLGKSLNGTFVASYVSNT